MHLGETQMQILSKMSVSNNLRAQIVTKVAKEDKEAEIATIAVKMVTFRETALSRGKRMIGRHDAWIVSNVVKKVIGLQIAPTKKQGLKKEVVELASNATKKAILLENVPTLIQAEIETMVVTIARATKTVQIGMGVIGTDLEEITTTTIMEGLVQPGDHLPKMMCR